MSFFGKIGAAGRRGIGAVGAAAGAAGAAGGRAWNATGGRGVKAFQGTEAYKGMNKSLSKRADFTLSYGSIVLITLLAASYLVVASLGIDTFTKKCKELAGVKTQENLNKWLVATLAIAITIPFTLIMVKVFGPTKFNPSSTRLNALMMLLFGILGIVASSAVIHWNRKCETPESEKIYGGINMAIYIVMLLIAMFLLRPKPVAPVYNSNGGVM